MSYHNASCEVCSEYGFSIFNGLSETVMCPQHSRELSIYIRKYLGQLYSKIILNDSYLKQMKDNTKLTYVDKQNFSKLLDQNIQIKETIMRKADSWINRYKKRIKEK